jgi:chemotaxis protein methyltransferase CheR
VNGSPISEAEFVLLRDLIHREAGIFLSPVKKALLVGRLSRRLRELGLPSFGAYYRYVQSESDPAERVRLLDCICTHETHFFRESRQFDFLLGRVLPQWEAQAAAGARPRQIRAWSAGCSTGEEPYSLAMALLSRLDAGWRVEILGTDLSTRALAKAQAALWPIDKAPEIPPAHRKAFMLRGVGPQQGWMKAGRQVRSVVRTLRHNLNDAWTPPGPFDLIFCRNVLIYFSQQSRSRVIERLLSALSPTGYLFLGHAESLSAVTNRLRSVGPTAYSWPEGSGRATPGRVAS